MRKIILLIFTFMTVCFIILIVNKQITINLFLKKEQVLKNENIFTEINDKDSIFTDNSSVYIVNLWSANCKPCLKEIPELNRLYNKHKKKEIRFIALSKFNYDSTNFAKLNIDYKFKKYYNNSKLFEYFQNLNPSKRKLIPITIVINNKGNIEFYFEGYKPQNIQKIDSYLSTINISNKN